MSDIRLVCFDLGGVLVRIHRSWQACCQAVGVESALGEEPVPHGSFEGFDLYQGGQIDTGEYVRRLAQWLQTDEERALSVHNSILAEAYHGTEQLVEDLHAAGIRTGCLSNTNEPHWFVMAESGKYPAIKALECKMGSHIVQLQKPDEAIFIAYEKEFGVEPRQVAYFDDTKPNVDAAAAHGWKAFWIDHEADTAAQMRAHLASVGVSLPDRTEAR